jgi:hypothetical protein
LQGFLAGLDFRALVAVAVAAMPTHLTVNSLAELVKAAREVAVETLETLLALTQTLAVVAVVLVGTHPTGTFRAVMAALVSA